MQQRFELWIGTQRLVGDLYLPDTFVIPFPCIITSHGYKSHRGGKKYQQIGYQFSSEGIAVLNIDHRGALDGESDGNFQDTTISRRTEDLLAAIDALGEVREIDSKRLGLLGSSLGGIDVLIVDKANIKAKVIMSTPFTFPPSSNKVNFSFAEKGYYQYHDETRINKELYEDFEHYDLIERVGHIKCPLLIIHGDLDELVPSYHAKILYKSATTKIKDIKIIEGGDHSFTNSHKLNQVLRFALDWFNRYL